MDDYRTCSDDRLLELLRTEGDRLPRAAVDEFVARGERMIKPLTRILKSTNSWDEEGAAYWQPVHAALILGAIGGEKAIPGLLAALQFSEDFMVDWIADALPLIFGSLGSPAVEPLLRFSREADPLSYERRAAFFALGDVANRHAGVRDKILNALREVAASDQEPDEARVAAANELLEFARPEDRELLLAVGSLADRLKVDRLFGLKDVHKAYEAESRDPAPPPDWLDFYSPEGIERREKERREVENLAELEEEDSESDEDWEDMVEEFEPEIDPDPLAPKSPAEAAPPLAKAAAAGRNAPCPCGSGKKFKKCCEK